MLPPTYRKLVVDHLSVSFKECTKIVSAPLADLLTTLRPTELLVKNKFAGVNASDINFSAGVYKPGVQPPFATGFEAVGEVVAIGEKAAGKFKVGDAVITQEFGGFSEFQAVPMRNAHVVPKIDAKYLPIEISGVTASIALERMNIQQGETALVTAAAGGTGHFAVQLLKHVYKCSRVIGTCSSASKGKFLRSIGCDVAIDYKTEDLSAKLQVEAPRGLNFVYESVGGDQFAAAVAHIALKGKILTIGSIVNYKSGKTFCGGADPVLKVPLTTHLLQRSASLHGFFLPHFMKHAPRHFAQLVELEEKGVIRSVVDETPFVGLEAVGDAVAHLHSGKNCGKVVVQL